MFRLDNISHYSRIFAEIADRVSVQMKSNIISLTTAAQYQLKVELFTNFEGLQFFGGQKF